MSEREIKRKIKTCIDVFACTKDEDEIKIVFIFCTKCFACTFLSNTF